MSKILTRTLRVRWDELNASGVITSANYLCYLIATVWDWGVAIGWDANYSQSPDVFWVIRETEIRYFSLPVRLGLSLNPCLFSSLFLRHPPLHLHCCHVGDR